MLKVVIVPVDVIGEPYEAQVKTHKKKRINKKWRKRYGLTTKYRDTGKTIILDDMIIMTERTYSKLYKEIEKWKF